MLYGQNQKLTNGNTYAIVIGVSTYADPSLDLNYAAKDANLFAEYLLSISGGSVPQGNIKLLTDENATVAKIEKELQWLLNTVEKNNKDLVYIYFSGHGLVETQLDQGYLLAHDSPSDAFLSNAVKLYEINQISDQLSKRNAKVRIIVDACYSGNASGVDNTSANLGARDRVNERENVIRITSSSHDEKSHEGVRYGGGRGAFSMHLIEGLQGKADLDGNMVVIKGELELYIRIQLKKDVNRNHRETQSASISGGDVEDKLAIVDSVMMANLNDPNYDPEVIRYQKSQMDLYLDSLRRIDISKSIDFSYWVDFSAEQLVDSVLLRTKDLLELFNLEEYVVRSQKDFKAELAVVVLDNVQQYLVAFMVGDDEELVKRGYFRPTAEITTEYADMLRVAMILVGEDHKDLDALKAKEFYFRGISLRLQSYQEKSYLVQNKILKDAIELLKKAQKYKGDLAYIYNELGVVYGLLNEDELALESFEKAIQYDVNWALPLSNLGKFWYDRAEYLDGMKYSESAVKLQPKNINGYVNLGLNSMQQDNFLLAEESFTKACDLYQDNYSGYDNLGIVYLMTGRYQDAEMSFQKQDSINRFYKSTILEDTLSNDYSNNIVFTMASFSEVQIAPIDNALPVDTLAVDSSNVIMLLTYGLMAEYNNEYSNAISLYNKILLLGDLNPLVYYRLAILSHKNSNYQDAERYALLALDHYVDKNLFALELQNLMSQSLILVRSWVPFCLENYFSEFELHALLAEIYADMGYLDKTGSFYQSEIDSSGINSMAFSKLKDIYLSKGLYSKAETLIRNTCDDSDPIFCKIQMYYLYEAATEDYYSPVIYSYKAAEQLYDLLDVKDDCGIDSLVFKCAKHYMDALEGSGASQKEDIYVKLSELYKNNKYDLQSKLDFKIVIDSIPDSRTSEVSILPLLIDMGESWKAYNIQKNLFEESLLDFENLDLMCSQSILAGDFETSDSLLNLLHQYPIDSLNIINKHVLRNMLSKDLEEALAQYEVLYDSDSTNLDYAYSICRLNAQLNRKEIAENYLKKCAQLGFEYYWVLTNDLYLNSLHETATYKRLKKQIMPALVRLD